MSKKNVILFPNANNLETPLLAHFCTHTAFALGIEQAIVLDYVRQSMRVEKLYLIEGGEWFRCTSKDWKIIFPYLSIQKVSYLLKHLQLQGYICIKKFDSHNPAIYKFYGVTESGWGI